MTSYDFDFLRYVERRKGAREAQSREGAAYAYGGDLKVLRTLDRLKPVRLALEGTVRLWRGSARAEILGPAMKATERSQPKVFAATEACAAKLHIAPPVAYVTPAPIAGGLLAWTFGTDEDPAILLHASLVEGSGEKELLDVLGRECGHVQNNHVLYRTALHFLLHAAGGFVRWIVKPATMALGAWHARAAVTADRAGLLCGRDLEVSTRMIGRLAGEAEAKRRIEALGLFAASAYYTGLSGAPSGPNSAECDAQVAKVLR